MPRPTVASNGTAVLIDSTEPIDIRDLQEAARAAEANTPPPQVLPLPEPLRRELRAIHDELKRLEQARGGLFRGYCLGVGFDPEATTYDLDEGVVKTPSSSPD